jgi:Cu-Zn family superoxide dismutase
MLHIVIKKEFSMKKTFVFFASLLFPLALFAETNTVSPEITAAPPATITVDMYQVAKDGRGESIGSVVFTDTSNGMLIETDLSGLTPGDHGFHVHTNPDCGDNGTAAGGHYDPAKAGEHDGPYGQGHLGDLPVLWVNAKGIAHETLIAPRLTVQDLKGHSIMIHGYGDNYSDTPAPLGGGGPRVACGVFVKAATTPVEGTTVPVAQES